MLKIADALNLRDIYDFQLSFQTPYFFDTSFEAWKQSFNIALFPDNETSKLSNRSLDSQGFFFLPPTKCLMYCSSRTLIFNTKGIIIIEDKFEFSL